MNTKKLFFLLCALIGITTAIAQPANSYFAGPDVCTAGSNNTYVGNRAANGATATSNAVFGDNSFINSTGSSNCVFGTQAMSRSDVLNTLIFNSGDGNCAIGRRALNNNTTGSNNVAIGFDVMRGNTTGSENIALGHNALYGNLGNENIAIGYAAGHQNGGDRNVYLGYGAGASASGNNNIAIGADSGSLITGVNNNFFGFQSGSTVTLGSGNLFLGNQSGQGVNAGNDNTFIGHALVNANVSNTIILADGSGNQRLYIDSNGKAGINLGNNVIPSNQLEIGTAVVSGTTGLRFRGLTRGTSATANTLGEVLTVNKDGDVILVPDAGGSGGGLTSLTAGTNITLTPAGSPTVTSYTVAAANLFTNDGTINTTSGLRTVTMGNNNLFFNTTQASGDTRGRVYIGNSTNFATTTGNYRLYVEGGILTEKVKVALRSTTNWADYVFNDDYKLQSLKDLEAFIKANKHLPNIPSAAELAKDGLDLAEMQAKQMEKIEELTLYAIEQDKKLDAQQRQIEEMNAKLELLLRNQK
ncbi:MAG: hypothetical protein CFE23_03575 [Flavobacterium sp. BFFFF1]|uniref:hypothetical protein n=1 Tax=Flavobacterium sp. BFFFF1 TaxID=2015557 RepID=UPI000BD1B2D7|nr:hypothetical protein [Flavobacterium sp. BFFFF1]OYU81559.1 MAG: hypothetical protein CFE23_03575 [Flavobacterium sp. BFFFF1]